LYDWSEIEYRQCIASSAPTEDNYYRGVIWLGELLHELERDGEAADLLDETLRLLILDKEDQKDREKFRQLQTRLKAMQRVRTRQDMQARAIFFRATHYRRLGDREKELEELSKGIKQISDDVDLLIAMHTVEDPTAEWKQLTSEKIRAVNARFRREVHDMFDSYEKARTNPPQREIFRAGLAQVLNQYAWLVGNTEGDIDEAIRNSHKSLEFAMGEGGYLDTLARCYYRAGKLDEALKYQSMAVERAPHELQIQKQLKMIRAAIAQQSQATGEPEPVVAGADSN
jgi:tetratricopeptide (TPR) repeat protein